MKKTNLIIFIILIILIMIILKFLKTSDINTVYAAGNNGSTSDIQLMARAINGEARGEPYEGQVAVRSGYFK